MRKLIGFLFWLVALALPVHAQHGPILTEGSTEPVALDVQWCATAPDVTIDAMFAQVCNWLPLDKSSVIRGLDTRAYWLRLSFHNRSANDLERWLEVGHPQMAQISLYLERPTGWELRHIGIRTPMSDRGAIENNYGVLPIELKAFERKTAWVRLSSAAVIILYTAVWKPDEFRREHSTRQFWVSLGIGGMCLVFVFSLMMLILTRQVAYGFFAIGQAGLFMVVSVTGGAFQRFFWPQDLPIIAVVRDLGGLLFLLGMYHFLHAFLPQVQRYPKLMAQMRTTVYVTVALILASQLNIDGSDALRFVTVTLCSFYAILLSASAWRDGDRAAGIILMAFISFFGFTALRLFVMAGFISYSPKLSLVPILSIFIFSPLMLLGLVDRTRQLQEEITRVRAESAAQLRFLAQMSHELRNPLDIVLGNAQLLAREAQTAAQISGVNSIFDSGRQLLRIIDHILDYARGAAGMLKMEPAPMRLGSFLRGVERMARLLAGQRNNRFELVLEGLPQALTALTVEADAERLRQVLGNLLANAARHTTDGVIALKVEAKPSLDNSTGLELEFTVSDTGEGISAEEQERIFRPFQRADSKANYGGKGAGLGLAIARQLVELMGGRLQVRSAPAQGAQFDFNVPVQTLTDHEAVSDERLDGFDAAGYLGPIRTVLVVDDDAVGRSVICQLLESLGFEVHQAAGGKQAVAMLTQNPAVDMVLTDQYMPDGDGWFVLERLTELMPQIPVVLISAARPSPPTQASTRLRFAAEFLRPIDHAQLLVCMGDILDLHWSEHGVDHDLQTRPCVACDTNAQILPEMALPNLALLNELASLIELGQVTAIEEWVRSLQSKEPICAPLAAYVLEALHQLDLQGLAAFLGEKIQAANAATDTRC